ncbi:MAG: ABC transporter ATP-binding protein [Oscillospiraceae bacterium]|nr:ABC transporter ATP-binding protein [Oscillospiraceae bacterium]
MQAPFLKLEDIKKEFNNGKKLLFQNLNLSISQKEIIGILGQNGCGKTTLVKIISGLLSPETGAIYMDGKKVKPNNTEYRSSISVLGDANRSLYWNLTGRQNIEYFSFLTSRSVDQQFFDEFVARMKMQTYIDNKVSYYSKGMKQKLMLLIALINMPRLVIMDEPLNGLDMESVCIIEDVIHAAAESRNTAFLITSHDKFFIDEVCSVKYEIANQTLSLVEERQNATTRTMTMYIETDDFPANSKVERISKLVDSKRRMYSISFGINDSDIYSEISKGIADQLYKIVSVAS